MIPDRPHNAWHVTVCPKRCFDVLNVFGPLTPASGPLLPEALKLRLPFSEAQRRSLTEELFALHDEAMIAV